MASATAFSMMESSVSRVFGGALVVDEDALVDRGFCEADGVDGGGGDALVVLAADEGELTHDGDERGRKCLEAEVREPKTEIELIGH